MQFMKLRINENNMSNAMIERNLLVKVKNLYGKELINRIQLNMNENCRGAKRTYMIKFMTDARCKLGTY